MQPWCRHDFRRHQSGTPEAALPAINPARVTGALQSDWETKQVGRPPDEGATCNCVFKKAFAGAPTGRTGLPRKRERCCLCRLSPARLGAGRLFVPLTGDGTMTKPKTTAKAPRAIAPTKKLGRLAPGPPPGSAKPATRSEEMITMMRTRQGATAQELASAVGWQPHSVRGFISGTIKKRDDLEVSAAKVDGHTRYRVRVRKGVAA